MANSIPSVRATTPIFLIYSREHNAWWRPDRMGYTRNIEEAGRYSWMVAHAIVFEANRYATPEEGPAEFCYPAPPPPLLLPSHAYAESPDCILTVDDPNPGGGS